MSSTPASMLQVVASGLQDIERLNSPRGKPSVDFYKSVMHRRTRWASQWVRVDFDNLADFGKTAIVTLPIRGELITRATLVVDLPDIQTAQVAACNSNYNNLIGPTWAWTNGIGHALCSDVQMLIGDQIIDQFDSQHLEVIDEQRRPVEHFDSTNTLIARDPSSYSDRQMFNNTSGTVDPTVPQTNPQTVEIVFPFWWNRGPGPQALPIQALWKDKVQLKVTFRPVQQCVYTSTRIDPRNSQTPLSTNQGTGPMPNIAGCGFFFQDPSGSPIYNAASTDVLASKGLKNPFLGSVGPPSQTMPTEYHFSDAYWIVEYVSLEDREASAYRMADMEIPIEQHMPLPVQQTGGASDIRIRIGQSGLVRDLTWVAQRVEAPTYNAYFLFSRDLGPLAKPGPVNPPPSPCDIPWWPNAQIPNWDFGNGYIVPAFADRRSDPIKAARLTYNTNERFDHEGPSIFRSLIPSLGSKRAPLIDRYIYSYDFGFWPTGGLAEALYLDEDQIRGCANWDKLPKRELLLTMNQDDCSTRAWAVDLSQIEMEIDSGHLIQIDPVELSQTTEGLWFILFGAQPDNDYNNGFGATVEGVIDIAQIRRQAGYIGLWARTVVNGSAALLLETSTRFTCIAVAGGGGYGQATLGRGGDAGWQGGNQKETTADVNVGTGGTVIYSNIYGNPITSQEISYATSNDITISSPVATNLSVHSVNLAFSIETVGQRFTIELTVQGVTFELDPPDTSKVAALQNYTLSPNQYISISPHDSIIISITSHNNFTTQYTNADGFLATRVTLEIGPSPTPISATIYGGGSTILSDWTDPSFINLLKSTGGTTYGFHGGDGYYGGDSGIECGGGGASYVSPLMTQTNTYTNSFIVGKATSSITLIPLKSVPIQQPNFNIHSWITRYNRLRINSGRGALMFNDTT